MNLILYTIVFIIGIAVGAFWDIKASEIPKNLDMKKVCYSKRKNEDKISTLTYIAIGGISSVILANVLKINEFDFVKLIIYVFAMLYISALVLIAGIDRNYLKIEKRVLAFGIISSIVYMVYLCAIDLASIHLNIIYLAIYMILLVIDSFLLKRYAKDSYIINSLLVLAMIVVFTDLRTLTYTLVMTTVAVALYTLLLKLQQKKSGNKKIEIRKMPIGYFIAASNIIVLFMIRIFENYCI